MTGQSRLIDTYHLLAFDEVDSTNEEARRLAERGAAHGAVVWAKRQTAGRGRMGREWVSKEGNLFVSVLLSPDKTMEELSQLSFVASLAMLESLMPVTEGSSPDKFSLKWPNDVLLGDKKIGGVLLEAYETSEGMPWVVVGVGINVEHYPDDVRFPATSLKQAGVELVSAKIVLSRFISHFMECYDAWMEQGFETIRKQWLSFAWRLEEQITLQFGEKTLTGIFIGIDEAGRLLLQEPDGAMHALIAGDVMNVDGVQDHATCN